MAENLGIKNAKWDKKDGFFVPRDCYNSYFYIVENEETSPVDKFILHGRAFTNKLDGGQCKPGLHCKPDEPTQGCAELSVLTVNRQEYRAKRNENCEGVTTNRDECSDVLAETSTVKKRLADGMDFPLIGRDSLYVCDVCHRTIPKSNKHSVIIENQKMTLCGKHDMQYKKYHKFLDSNPYSTQNKNDYIITDEGVWIITRYKNGRESGRFLIDKEDLDIVLKHKWRLWRDFYFTGNLHPVQISRFLFGLSNNNNVIVDHINGNRQDNRRCNLRITNTTQNSINKAILSNNKTGVTGVYFDPTRNKYAVEIRVYNIKIHLSRYSDFADACFVRYVAERIAFGEYRSFRNDDTIFEIISKCENKNALQRYAENKVGTALQSRRAS